MENLEKEILKTYYAIPLYCGQTQVLTSDKVYYPIHNSHVFMEFGGIEYLKYNYTDSEWAIYLNSKRHK